MRQSNRKLLGLAAASVLALGSVAAVLAAAGQGTGDYPGMMGGPGGMMGMGPGGMMGGSVSATTARLTQIKGELGITTAQESAWKAYEQAVINQSALMDAHRQTMMSGTLPPPTDQRAAMHQQGTEMMQQTAQATQGLYQVLTPAQGAKADNLLLLQPGRGMAQFGR
jgi:Spy/CpxP family protein refolding chaperone